MHYSTCIRNEASSSFQLEWTQLKQIMFKPVNAMTRQLYVSMSVQQPSLDKQNTMEIKKYEADKIDRDKQHLPTTCS